MSNRNWMIVAFVAGGLATLGGIIYLTTRDKPGTGGGGSVATAADAKGSEPFVLTETGPVRPYNKDGSWGCFAYRQQATGQSPSYAVDVNPYGFRMSPEEAKRVIVFYETYKGKKKSDAKEIVAAQVHFGPKMINGNFTIAINLATGVFTVSFGGGHAADVEPFIASLRQALDDVEAMKKVPGSVTP